MAHRQAGSWPPPPTRCAGADDYSEVRMQVNSRTSTTTAPSLTDREMMILFLMGAGRTTSEIAFLLGLRPRTVENRKRHIYEKLGVGSQSQAIARAIRMGLFQPDDPGTSGSPPEHAKRHAGRATLVVLSGAAGKDRDDVARLLLREHIAFVTVHRREGLIDDHWLSWHCGPTVVVLVNPRPRDRLVISSLHAPAVEVFSQDGSGQAALARLMAGNAGGLIANADVATGLLLALEATAQGLLVMSRRYAAALLRSTDAQVPAGPHLTGREQDILDSIAHGYTNRQTARALGIATKLLKTSRHRFSGSSRHIIGLMR